MCLGFVVTYILLQNKYIYLHGSCHTRQTDLVCNVNALFGYIY